MDDIAQNLLVEQGYSHLATHLRQQVINLLTTYECDGEILLRTRFTTQHEGSGYQSFLAIGNVFAVVTINPKFINYLCYSNICFQ